MIYTKSSGSVLRGLKALKTNITFAKPDHIVTFRAAWDELSLEGTYAADLLISDFIPASGTGDYALKYNKANFTLSFRLEEIPSTGILTASDVHVVLGFEKMETYIQNFRLGSAEVDWSLEKTQIQFQDLVTDILTSQDVNINALVQNKLGSLLQV
jgi:hypothetical protein